MADSGNPLQKNSCLAQLYTDRTNGRELMEFFFFFILKIFYFTNSVNNEEKSSIFLFRITNPAGNYKRTFKCKSNKYKKIYFFQDANPSFFFKKGASRKCLFKGD